MTRFTTIIKRQTLHAAAQMVKNRKYAYNEKLRLETIFQAINPVNDPNFTVRNGKCFHSAPSESWDAVSRAYSYSIEWTYEREV